MEDLIKNHFYTTCNKVSANAKEPWITIHYLSRHIQLATKDNAPIVRTHWVPPVMLFSGRLSLGEFCLQYYQIQCPFSRATSFCSIRAIGVFTSIDAIRADASLKATQLYCASVYVWLGDNGNKLRRSYLSWGLCVNWSRWFFELHYKQKCSGQIGCR